MGGDEKKNWYAAYIVENCFVIPETLLVNTTACPSLVRLEIEEESKLEVALVII